MELKAIKKLLEISVDTISGVFPYLKFDLKLSNDGTEVNLTLETVRMDGFSSEASKQVVVAFQEDQVRYIRVPLETEKRFLSFGYDSMIQLFVFLVSFFSVYLNVSIKQILNFFFHKEMDWREFFRFVLASNLIDTGLDNGAVYVYGIGILELRGKTFYWTDPQYNEFSYKTGSDLESLFVLSFVLGFIQASLGHDLLVSNLVEPEENTENQGTPDATEEIPSDLPPEDLGGLGDLGGMGDLGGLGGPGGGLGGDLGGLGDDGLGGAPGEGEGLPGEDGLGAPPDFGAEGAPGEEGEPLPEEEEPIPVPGGGR